MIQFKSAIFLYIIFMTRILASPINSTIRDTTYNPDLTPAENEFLEPIRQEYKGIYWDIAWQYCSRPEFDILVEATRMALEMVHDFQTDNVETLPAWDRYFVSDDNGKNQWSVSD
jgi:hypothetical protein